MCFNSWSGVVAERGQESKGAGSLYYLPEHAEQGFQAGSLSWIVVWRSLAAGKGMSGWTS